MPLRTGSLPMYKTSTALKNWFLTYARKELVPYLCTMPVLPSRTGSLPLYNAGAALKNWFFVDWQLNNLDLIVRPKNV